MFVTPNVHSTGDSESRGPATEAGPFPLRLGGSTGASRRQFSSSFLSNSSAWALRSRRNGLIIDRPWIVLIPAQKDIANMGVNGPIVLQQALFQKFAVALGNIFRTALSEGQQCLELSGVSFHKFSSTPSKASPRPGDIFPPFSGVISFLGSSCTSPSLDRHLPSILSKAPPVRRQIDVRRPVDRDPQESVEHPRNACRGYKTFSAVVKQNKEMCGRDAESSAFRRQACGGAAYRDVAPIWLFSNCAAHTDRPGRN